MVFGIFYQNQSMRFPILGYVPSLNEGRHMTSIIGAVGHAGVFTIVFLHRFKSSVDKRFEPPKNQYPSIFSSDTQCNNQHTICRNISSIQYVPKFIISWAHLRINLLNYTLVPKKSCSIPPFANYIWQIALNWPFVAQYLPFYS